MPIGEAIAVIETKSPDIELTLEHRNQLRSYLEMGASPFGILSNLHKLILYEYSLKIGLKKIADINVNSVIKKNLLNLSVTERNKLDT